MVRASTYLRRCMRRVTGVALILVAMLTAASPAQAAPRLDPVTVLKAQFVEGQGVKVLTAIRVSFTRDLYIRSRQTGTVQFGGGGPVASDFTEKIRFSESFLRKLPKKERAKY